MLLTLHAHLAKIAQKLPEQTALIFGSHKIEYGRLMEAIKRLAQGLAAQGVQKGDRIAIMLPNVPHFCISYYAALELGAVVVPINFFNNSQEIGSILSDCGAKAIIYWNGFGAQIAPALAQAPDCKHSLVLGESIPQNSKSLTQIITQSSALDVPVEVVPDDLAMISYISGTGDGPLGAAFTHSALMANTSTCHEMFRITSEERLLGIMPLFHPLGQTLEMNAAFFVGATLLLLPRFAPAEAIDAIRQHTITFFAGVPAMFQSLNESLTEENTTPSLKYCLSYGGQLNPALLSEFERKFDALVLEAYGFTEAGPLVTSNRINRDRKNGSVGLPLVGVEVQVVDEQGQIVKPNQSGEIWIKSPSLTQGYFNKPEETQKRMRDGWFFSGDIGYLDEELYLFVQERKEDIIVKGGFQIFPFEVEEVIKQHPAVAEAAVVAVADPVQGHEVKAFVVLDQEQQATVEELTEFCKGYLPVYKVPKFIEICALLPKGPTGRVQKQTLRSGSAVEKP
ncbi:AMP-binding protein [candidate division KSB1 bacterium]|nr:AMP-binding protein [candidate division KSB1 bacterium]